MGGPLGDLMPPNRSLFQLLWQPWQGMSSCHFCGCGACGVTRVFVVARAAVGLLFPSIRFVGDIQAGVPGVTAALAPGTVEGLYDGALDKQLSFVVLAAVVLVLGGSVRV